MMGEVSLETSRKRNMIQDMINSQNSMNKTESTNKKHVQVKVYPFSFGFKRLPI